MGDRFDRSLKPPREAPVSSHTQFKNSPLEKDVIARLEADPRIADSAEIAVVGDGGTVTLRGTVEHLVTNP